MKSRIVLEEFFKYKAHLLSLSNNSSHQRHPLQNESFDNVAKSLKKSVKEFVKLGCRPQPYLKLSDIGKRHTSQTVDIVGKSTVSKNLSRVNIAARTIWSDVVMSLQAEFCPLLYVYYNDMQINRLLPLTITMEFPFAAVCSEKHRPEKFPLMTTSG